jgi:hypothetical protein
MTILALNNTGGVVPVAWARKLLCIELRFIKRFDTVDDFLSIDFLYLPNSAILIGLIFRIWERPLCSFNGFLICMLCNV